MRGSETAVLAGALVFLLAFASLSFISTPASAALAGEWVEEISIGGPRAQAVFVQDTGGLLYVAGGTNDTTYYNPTDEVNAYKLESGAWSSVAPLPFATRGAAGAVGADGRVYVFGGDGGVGVLDAVQIYDPDSDSWDVGTSIPVGVWEARAALGYDGMIYVIGGYTDVGTVTSAVQIYDPVLDSWSSGASMPGARNAGALVSYSEGSTFYYLGGSTVSWTDDSDDFYGYSVSSDYWYSMTSMPVPLASHAAALGTDGSIYVIGGADTGHNVGVSYDTTYRYSFSDGEWYIGPDLPAGVRHAGAAATPEGMVYLIGGNDDVEAMDTVLSLEVAHSEITVSGTSVAQGGYLDIGISFDFAFSEPEDYSVDVYLMSDSGAVRAVWEFWVPIPAPGELRLDVSETMPAGEYTLVVSLLVWTGWNPAAFPDAWFDVTVTDSYTLEEQLEMLKTNLTELMDSQSMDIADLQTGLALLEASLTDLEAQLSDADGNITDLQAQLDQLQNTLTALQGSMDDVQTSVDKKATNALLYAVIGLLVVVIVLMLVMMVMGRRSGSPPPPPST